MTPNQKNFFDTYFFEKSPTHNNAAPKINAWEQKIGGGGFYSPPPDRIGLKILQLYLDQLIFLMRLKVLRLEKHVE